MRSSSRRSRSDAARRELIGLAVEVRSAHEGWNGLTGTVVDETKHTFLVEIDASPRGRVSSGAEPAPETTSKVVKRVPKAGNRFVFRDGTDAHEINGNDITFQPEDRTKRIRG